jgi:hypothetical protein
MAATAYAGLLQKEFEVAKLLTKQDVGFTFTTPAVDILQTAELKVSHEGKKMTIDLPEHVKIFSFEFDQLDNGLQRVELLGDCGKEDVSMERISYKDEWRIKFDIPGARTLYVFRPDRCTIKIVGSTCKPEKVKITYIPDITSEDDDAYIPSRKAMQILNVVIQVMNGADMQKAIDMTINGNPNTNQYTESDLSNDIKKQ